MAQDPNVKNMGNCPSCADYKEAMVVTLELLIYAIDPVRTVEELNGVRVTVAKMFAEMNNSIQNRPGTGGTHTHTP